MAEQNPTPKNVYSVTDRDENVSLFLTLEEALAGTSESQRSYIIQHDVTDELYAKLEQILRHAS